MESPLDSPRTPRTPRLETKWEETEDYLVADGGKTIVKEEFGYEQGAVTEQVCEGEATFMWTFTINKAFYDDSHSFMGVADMLDEMAWGFSPCTGSLYWHADKDRWGKECKTRIMGGKALYGKQEGSKVTVICDMANHTLAFQIHEAGKEEPEDIVELEQNDCELPARIKPWVMLGHKGDSVTISDITELC
mmetsp:Transcript_45232/g.119378  ORF Transcript_45232/g.119378 Transcript_45232/m.119378 type:complete len:191 (+) Transcript_45232:3-575(+)|eukprot:2380440-Prymnesium_polylepis.1